MIEWTPPHFIRSAEGELALNATTGDRYLLVQDGCSQSRSLRVVSDPVPQADGEIFHARFADGTQIDLTMQLWKDDAPACGEDARLMYETLSLHLNAMLNDGGRYLWTPSGASSLRMMDEARWLAPIVTTYLDGGIIQLEFSIDSPFPYFIDEFQLRQGILDGVAEDVINTGNAPFYPIIIVQNATTAFTIDNLTTEQRIVYDSARIGALPIGAGDIAEIDTYRNTIYLGEGGEPGDDANLKAGIDPTQTDYFTLVPGVNSIEVFAADADILVNAAWLP